MEEWAKARWLYQAGESEWSRLLGLLGSLSERSRAGVVPEQLRVTCRPHTEKLAAAEQYASGLAGCWGISGRSEHYFPADLATFDSAAKTRNVAKQAGL